MSQEQLAEAAGLSVGVVRKVEQGGNVQVETLHMLARALGTTTSSLFATEAPEPLHADVGDGPKLSELRRALMPPVGLREVLVEAEQAPTPAAIQRDIEPGGAVLVQVQPRFPDVSLTCGAVSRVREPSRPRRRSA